MTNHEAMRALVNMYAAWSRRSGCVDSDFENAIAHVGLQLGESQALRKDDYNEQNGRY